MKCRQTFREKISAEFGTRLLSFRAARLIAMRGFKTPDEVRAWLIRPSTRNTKDLGSKTFTELCLRFGMAAPSKAPRTLEMQVHALAMRVEELEKQLLEAAK